MKQYLDSLQYVLDHGRRQMDRTGTGTLTVFGTQTKYKIDLNAFPIVTTKKVNFDSIVKELLWFIKGDTNSTSLEKQGCNIWKPWALKDDYYFGKKESEISEEYWQASHLENLNCSATIHAQEGNLLTNETLYPGEKKVFTVEEHLKILQETDYEKKVELYRQWGIDMPRKNFYATQFKAGELGPVYGAQWRRWLSSNEENGYIDQLADLMENLKSRPFSRRHILTAWNPEVLPDESKSHEENILAGKAVLASCHCMVQFHVEELTLIERIDHYLQRHGSIIVNGEHFSVGQSITASISFNEEIWTSILNEKEVPKLRLSSLLLQRSQDKCLGEPYNITSYCLLTAMIAHCLNMATGEFVYIAGNSHIYLNHIDGAKEQLTRTPKKLPSLIINPEKKDIFSFTLDDFKLIGYDPDPFIKFPVAV